MIEEGDIIKIDIPHRSIELDISDEDMARRREMMETRGELAWRPKRKREVSDALKAYAAMTTSASRGAVRDVSQLYNK